MSGEERDPDRPPAGWYSDPTGEASYRWWDGVGWTQHASLDGAPAGGSASPSPVGGVLSPPTREALTTGRDANGYPRAPRGARLVTAGTVLFVLLPLSGIARIIAARALGAQGFAADLRRTAAQNGRIDEAQVAELLTFVTAVFGIVLGIYLLAVVFARLDWGGLRRAGVVRPFHWAWTFLHPWAYIIGRTVVLRRRASRGQAPLIVYFAIVVALQIASTLTQLLLPGGTGSF